MRSREELERIEDQTLAPYAMRSSQTLGREYPDDEHPYRTAFQKDRDRIIHTTAFRRLEYKTQVFINYEGDYYRTRLTHT
ncbi:MAG: deoxyguanosinetriphosphate triphosphohydrolase, partial [Ardenticatenia bacterium]